MSARRARLPRGTLSREVIVEAALRTLARPDAGPVTLRTLARELGADPTAVYRHFDGKDDLLGALTDRLLEPLLAPPPAPGWRAQLEALGAALEGLFERSPGAVAVLAESPFTPVGVRALEATVAAVEGHGVPPTLAAQATQAVVVHVVGHAAGTAGDAAGFWAGLAAAGPTAGELPALTASADAWLRPASEQLRTGLGLLLDGVGLRLAAAAPHTPPPAA